LSRLTPTITTCTSLGYPLATPLFLVKIYAPIPKRWRAIIAIASSKQDIPTAKWAQSKNLLIKNCHSRSDMIFSLNNNEPSLTIVHITIDQYLTLIFRGSSHKCANSFVTFSNRNVTQLHINVAHNSCFYLRCPLNHFFQ
jgi:hypothetical protein